MLLARALWEGRRIRSLLGEVLRQAALVATGSVLVLVVVLLLAGGGCGIESVAISRQLGARGAVGALAAFCTLREIVPFAFGYVLVLGIGCELVADLAEGEENAARAAAPRVLGVLLVFPFAFLLAYACASVAAFGIGIGRFGDVSQGTFIGLFLAFQDDTDLAFSIAKGLLMAVFVLAAALLFGARAGRGVDDPGPAVARFALVAVVGVTVVGALASIVLWGANPRIPAG